MSIELGNQVNNTISIEGILEAAAFRSHSKQAQVQAIPWAIYLLNIFHSLHESLDARFIVSEQ